LFLSVQLFVYLCRDKDQATNTPDRRSQDGLPVPPASQTSRAPLVCSTGDRKYYLSRIADVVPPKRQRRDTSTAAPLAANPSNWWYDTDSGRPDSVTAALRRDNPFVGAQLDRARLMDQFGVPISVSGGRSYQPVSYGYPPVPYSYPQMPSGYPPVTNGYSTVPYGYQPGPYGYQPVPSGYQPVPYGFQPTPYNRPQDPYGYSQEPYGYPPAPYG
jgi:hypothetical protein